MSKHYFHNFTVLKILFLCSFAAAQNFDNVKIETIKITDNIFMLQGTGGNIGVSVGDDGVFLIDDQYAQLTEKIKSAISNISTQPIKFVINTHFHGDHTGGNEQLGEAGALIISHDNTRKRMTEEQFIEFFKSKMFPSPKGALPIVTFSNSVTFHMNEDEIYVFHAELAHTDGDVIIYFRKGNVIHMGDIYQTGGFPFIDVPNGGTIKGMIDAVDQSLKIINTETKVIPGHGPLSNQKELTEFREMLITVRDRVQEQLNKNKSFNEIISTRPASGYFEETEHPFTAEDFIKFVYDSLTK